MLRFRKGVDSQARGIFFRTLATLFGCGVPLVAALELLAQQQEDPRLAEACKFVAVKLSEGNYLSRCLQLRPAVFLPVHQKMVAGGERSGQLHAVLLKLADHEERQQKLRRNLSSSLMMPLMVSLFCVALAILAPPFFFGPLFQMIREVGGAVPWPTRVLMALSGLLTSPWFYLALLPLIALGVKAGQRMSESEEWQLRLLQVPVLGPTLRLYLVAQFTENLSSMLEVGVPVLVALEQASRAVNAACLDGVIRPVQAEIRDGESLSRALERARFFPSVLVQGVRASEEAGGLTAMLRNLERLFAVDLEQRIEVFTRTLEPLVLGVVGCIVGFTLVASLMPLLSVLDKL